MKKSESPYDQGRRAVSPGGLPRSLAPLPPYGLAGWPLSTFTFNTSDIRVMTADGQPLFILKDACEILGHTNASMAVKVLEAGEWTKVNLGQRGLGAVIAGTESGLYKLIMRSDKPEAKDFQN